MLVDHERRDAAMPAARAVEDVLGEGVAPPRARHGEPSRRSRAGQGARGRAADARGATGYTAAAPGQVGAGEPSSCSRPRQDIRLQVGVRHPAASMAGAANATGKQCLGECTVLSLSPTSNEEPMADLSGRTLGEFVLREQIAEGGYGAVYRSARDWSDHLPASLHTTVSSITLGFWSVPGAR